MQSQSNEMISAQMKCGDKMEMKRNVIKREVVRDGDALHTCSLLYISKLICLISSS